GPPFLRRMSCLFPLRRGDGGRPLGWFDYTDQTKLLEGVRMADAGNVPCQRVRGPAQLDVLPDVYRALRETTRLLVILGGDHSVSYWLAKSLRSEGLVW